MNKRQNNKEYYLETEFEIPKCRFNSYWHQIHEVLKTKPKDFLEIGVGSSFVSNYLKCKKMNVKTFDIDKKLNPDVVGDITNLSKSFKENSFDTILCSEVLEHLPFNSFRICLKEILQVSKRNVIISLPHHALQGVFYFKFPAIKKFLFKVRIPFPFRFRWKIGGAHYWEIGWKGYSLRKIKKIISEYFEIKEIYSVTENPYHWFFVLRKKTNMKRNDLLFKN